MLFKNVLFSAAEPRGPEQLQKHSRYHKKKHSKRSEADTINQEQAQHETTQAVAWRRPGYAASLANVGTPASDALGHASGQARDKLVTARVAPANINRAPLES